MNFYNMQLWQRFNHLINKHSSQAKKIKNKIYLSGKLENDISSIWRSPRPGLVRKQINVFTRWKNIDEWEQQQMFSWCVSGTRRLIHSLKLCTSEAERWLKRERRRMLCWLSWRIRTMLLCWWLGIILLRSNSGRVSISIVHNHIHWHTLYKKTSEANLTVAQKLKQEQCRGCRRALISISFVLLKSL